MQQVLGVENRNRLGLYIAPGQKCQPIVLEALAPFPAPQRKTGRRDIIKSHGLFSLAVSFHHRPETDLNIPRCKSCLFLFSFPFSSILTLQGQECSPGSYNCCLPLLHLQCVFIWGPFLPFGEKKKPQPKVPSSACLFLRQ